MAGRRSSGSWDNHGWLISKDNAYMEANSLILDTEDASNLIKSFGSKPNHVKEDVFEVTDSPYVSESNKAIED